MKLYKYYSLATKAQMGYAARAIIEREIHCGDPATFNDPFDCNIAIHLKVYLKKLGVACFSGEEADHVLMFSHYGDRHRGIAFVFDVVSDGPIGDLTFLGLGPSVNYVEHDRLPDLSMPRQFPSLSRLDEVEEMGIRKRIQSARRLGGGYPRLSGITNAGTGRSHF